MRLLSHLPLSQSNFRQKFNSCFIRRPSHVLNRMYKLFRNNYILPTILHFFLNVLRGSEDMIRRNGEKQNLNVQFYCMWCAVSLLSGGLKIDMTFRPGFVGSTISTSWDKCLKCASFLISGTWLHSNKDILTQSSSAMLDFTQRPWDEVGVDFRHFIRRL